MYNIGEAKGEDIIMAKKRTALTKEQLQALGVTDVRRDGTVYVHGTKKNPTKLTTRHKYGNNVTYLAIALQDYSKKVKTIARVPRKTKEPYVHESWAYAVRTVTLGRLVMAWYKGEVPGDMDVDHIDGNPLNNHIDNLQIISRRENLAKRSLSWEEINRLYHAKKKEQGEK